MYESNEFSKINSIAINNEGYIITGGFTLLHGKYSFIVTKIDTYGEVDLSFGVGGYVTTQINNSYSQVNSIALQNDHKIVVGGITRDNSNIELFTIARYTSTGQLDTTFNSIGYVTTTIVIGQYSRVQSILLQPDQKIVAGGLYILYLNGSALARYNNPPVPINNICFIEGTPVLTDQGPVAIEKLISRHTIGYDPVRMVTKTIGIDKYLVRIKKGALGFNTPSQDTTMTMSHKICHNRIWVNALDLVNHKTIVLIPYDGGFLYNVLMDTHQIMVVNGLFVETLDPQHILSKIYRSNHTDSEKNIMICKLNEQILC